MDVTGKLKMHRHSFPILLSLSLQADLCSGQTQPEGKGKEIWLFYSYKLASWSKDLEEWQPSDLVLYNTRSWLLTHANYLPPWISISDLQRWCSLLLEMQLSVWGKKTDFWTVLSQQLHILVLSKLCHWFLLRTRSKSCSNLKELGNSTLVGASIRRACCEQEHWMFVVWIAWWP